MRQMIPRILTDDEGSALVEGTVVVPFLFALVFGVLEFSYYFYQHHLVSTGVRDAARYLARVENPNSGTAQLIAQSLAATGSPTPGSTFRRVAGFNPANVIITVTPIANVSGGICGVDPCRGTNPLNRITVTGTFGWTPLGFWGFFGFGSKNVTVTHSERGIGIS
jgi:Flp pilus assembly protein TadG